MDNNDLRIFNMIDTKFSLLMNNPNVCGIAHGYKTINHNTTNIPSLTFFVKKKFNSSALNPCYLIPKTINGAISDVVEVGKFQYCSEPMKATPPLRYGYTIQNGPQKAPLPARPGYHIQNPFNRNSGVITCALRSGLLGRGLLLLTAGHVLRAENSEDPNCIIYPKLAADEELGSRVDDSFNEVFYLSKVKTVPKEQHISSNEYYNTFDFGIVNMGPYNDTTMKNIFSPKLLNNESFGFILDPLKDIKGSIEMLNVDLGSSNVSPKLYCTKSIVEIENKENKTLYRNQIVVSGIPSIPNYSGSMLIIKQIENRCDAIGMVMGRAVSGTSRNGGMLTVVTPLFNIIAAFPKDIGKTELKVSLLRDEP